MALFKIGRLSLRCAQIMCHLYTGSPKQIVTRFVSTFFIINSVLSVFKFKLCVPLKNVGQYSCFE